MKGFIIFSLGVIAGAAVTFNYMKNRSEAPAHIDIADDIDTTDEPEHLVETIDLGKLDIPPVNPEEVNEYHNVIKLNNYSEEEPKPFQKTESNPTIIPDMDVDYLRDNEGYDVVAWTYFEGDDTLVDETYEVVKDRDDVLGPGVLEKIGMYNPDVLYISDDRLKLIYEISADQTSWKNFLLMNPYLVHGV